MIIEVIRLADDELTRTVYRFYVDPTAHAGVVVQPASQAVATRPSKRHRKWVVQARWPNQRGHTQTVGSLTPTVPDDVREEALAAVRAAVVFREARS